MSSVWKKASDVAQAVEAAQRDADLDEVAEGLDVEKSGHRAVLASLGVPTLKRLAAHVVKTKREQGFAVRGTTLADKLAAAATTLAQSGRFDAALRLFDAVLQVPNLDLATYNNALWAVQADNNKLGVNRERAKAYLEACVPYGPKNPAIFFNAACVWFELGEREQVYEAIREARRHGYSSPQKMHDERLFKPLRGVAAFEALFVEKAVQGAPLVEQVVAKLKADAKARKDFGLGTPKGLSKAVLDALTLPNGAPLPPSLRAWLAYDATWLQGLGWFSSLDPVRWAPRTLREVVEVEFGPEWSQFFDVPELAQCFVLDGGSDSRRIFVVTDSPDSLGEHPVMLVDIDDMPYLCLYMPGLDIYLAEWASLLSFPRGTYEDVPNDARVRDRVQHHVKHLLHGELSVEFPVDTLGTSARHGVDPHTGEPLPTPPTRPDGRALGAKARKPPKKKVPTKKAPTKKARPAKKAKVKGRKR